MATNEISRLLNDLLGEASLALVLGMILGTLLLATGLFYWISNAARKEIKGEKTNATLTHLQQRLEQRQHDLERLHSVLKLSATLNASLNFERVQELALDLGTAALGDSALNDDRPISALLMVEDESLRVASARGFPHADLRTRLPARKGILAKALNSARPVICNQPLSDPELSRLSAMLNSKSVICVPLAQGLEAFGLLLFGHSKQGFFDEARLELLELIAQQAVIALQNASLYGNLEKEKEHIKEAQEEARRKLARDLHDGPTQSIGAITMRVNYIRRLMERDPRAAAKELYKVERLARRTTKEMRQMLFALRPLVLEAEGLISALRHLASQTRDTYGQEVKVEAIENAARGLDARKQNVVFCIAEEAVANARKHARADNIWVRVWSKGDMFHLTVEDDGVGFDLDMLDEGYEQSGSLGMINMQERTELVNGRLKIDTSPGGGTSIRMAVPLTAEAAERIRAPGFAA